MANNNSSDYSPTNFLVQAGATAGRLQDIPSGTTGQVLTSQGAGALPIWSTGGGGGGSFSSINVQTFTSSGTYTPTTGMAYCFVQLVGGGGGGGGGNTTPSGTGGPGAAGGYSQKVFSAATIGASQTVTIGAAGAGGIGAAGTDGGTSTFGSFLTCTGGQATPITTVPPAPWAVGGSGSGGDYNQLGGQPVEPFSFTGSIILGGGASYFGPGALGQSIPSGTNFNGLNAVSYGSGGGPGFTAFGPVNGGNGAAGFCIITEYIS